MSDEVCTCKFVAIGVPIDSAGCVVHTQTHYSCGCCNCDDYRPKKVADPAKGQWPVCICGHVAQDHN